MSKVNFYHLTKLAIEKALPKLVEKVYSSGHKVKLQVKDDAEMEQFDKVMWTYTTKFFLPHGTSKDPFKERQPVYISSEGDNPNNSDVLLLLRGVSLDGENEFGKYAKILYMFDGNNAESVAAARGFWKKLKDAGHELVYWQQNSNGAWEEGATSG